MFDGKLVSNALRDDILEHRELIFIEEKFKLIGGCIEKIKYSKEKVNILMLLHKVIIGLKLNSSHTQLLFDLNTLAGKIEYDTFIKSGKDIFFLFRYSEDSGINVSVKTFKAFSEEIGLDGENTFQDKAKKINEKFSYLLDKLINDTLENTYLAKQELICIKDDNIFICPQEEFINYKIKNVLFKLYRAGYLENFIFNIEEIKPTLTLYEDNIIYPEKLDGNIIFLKDIKLDRDVKTKSLSRTQIEILKDLEGNYIKCSTDDYDILFDYKIKGDSKIEVLVYWLYDEGYAGYYENRTCKDFYMYYRGRCKVIITDIYSNNVKYIFYVDHVDRSSYNEIADSLYNDIKMFIQSLKTLEQNLHKLMNRKEIGELPEMGLKSERIYFI